MPNDQPFERVAHAYRGALQRLAAAYERDPHEQEDLVQDILFALWRALPSFRGECSERTFVYRVRATNAGTFQVPPAFAEGMYNRAIAGLSKASSLEVVKP